MALSIGAVLFDLDGTLVDTAPDLGFAINEIRRQRGVPALPLETIRPTISGGSLAMTSLATNAPVASDEFEQCRQELLRIYRDNIARSSALFPNLEALLRTLERREIDWGVVTNKSTALSERLLEALGLAARAAVVVCGDTLPQSKPHPAPLLFAAERIGANPSNCIYIGDAERDIAAGRAAGMTTAAATYGYLADADDPLNWDADALLASPAEIWPWLKRQGLA